MLFKAKDEMPQGAVEEVLDHIWSLQYMMPNILCGSAGAVLSRTHVDGLPAYSHALHLRFASGKVLEAFLGSPQASDSDGRGE